MAAVTDPQPLILEPGTIAKLDLGPDDAVVIYANRRITSEQAKNIMETVRSALPSPNGERKVLVLPPELGLGVLEQTA